MIIILIGPPGSGKGTQSEMLVSALSTLKEKNNYLENIGVENICVGNILREEIEKETQLGLKAKAIIERGDLLSDQDVFEIVKSRLNASSDVQFIILDGYPRTLEQAKLLENYSTQPLKVIYFSLDRSHVIDRLNHRLTCKNCGKIYNLKTTPPKISHQCDDCGSDDLTQRADDAKEAVLQRLENYEEKTKPLIDFYARNGVLYNIDASQEKHKIHEEIVRIIQEK